MTKLRPPASFEQAIDRIAGFIGWAAIADELGKSERTVRDYSDPDTPTGIRLDDALRLDVAYRRAGGEGAPIDDCYRLQLDLVDGLSVADSDRLLDQLGVVARESGEAMAALARASRSNATPADKALARRELAEAIQAKTAMAAMIAEPAGEGHRHPP